MQFLNNLDIRDHSPAYGINAAGPPVTTRTIILKNTNYDLLAFAASMLSRSEPATSRYTTWH